MKIEVIPITAFQQNCSIVWCERTKRAAVIDPGGDLDRILAVVERYGLVLEKILITHAHLDHAGATAELSRRFSLPIEGPQTDDSSGSIRSPRKPRCLASHRQIDLHPIVGSARAIGSRSAISSLRCFTARGIRRGTSFFFNANRDLRSWVT